MALNPDLYTITDPNAWASLKANSAEEFGLPKDPSFWNLPLNECDTYGEYLAVCRRLADALHVELRMLDRCLFVLAGSTPDEFLAKAK